jgi:hypothetical protein
MRADLTTGLARDLEDGIDAMAASGENAWLLGREGGYGRAFLAKIAAGSETLARVSEFGDDLPLAVAARGSTLAVLLAHVTESASAHYVTWSRDGGKTWSRADAEAGQRVCIDPGGRIWVAGRSAVWLEGE